MKLTFYCVDASVRPHIHQHMTTLECHSQLSQKLLRQNHC